VFATEDFQHVRLVAGADIRQLEGATHEDVLIPNRRRKAGGEQTITGAFVKLANQPEQLNQYELNLRMDYWSLDEGHRTETSKSTGVQARDDHYRDRDDWEPSISLATAHQLADSLRLNIGSGYTFRLPTINELYRPYRVGNDITEANAELNPERFLNLEAGLTWQAHEQLSLRTGVFQYWIDDAIANVRTAAPVGVFVPSGGSYNQRQNVDSATVFGWENRLEYTATDTLTFALNYLYTQAEFEDSKVQSELEGKSFPQVPTHKATASVDYKINQQLLLFGSIEYGSSQYDDPLNDRKLPDYMTGQVGASYQLTNAVRLVGRVDNLADATVITGERSNGVRSIAPGRSLWLSVWIDW
ncbi:MAG: outer membrane receptor protein involved in Fe transport, partial [Lentimonas sp.]